MANLVKWLPFGQEAFAQANKAQKPVFLHIGFPSCHWCHVMEKESFSDPEVAGILNERFVPIDVDREKRPDVDAVYMAACHAMTGQGGWPLTALLTPAQRPFFIATYLPKDALLNVLQQTLEEWSSRREQIGDMGRRLTRAIRQQFTHAAGTIALGERMLEGAVRAFAAAFDEPWGGMGIAPKFPMAHTLTFLIRKSAVTQDPRAEAMAMTTLQRMCEGGIFDHVAGGFMRYATDRRWQVPHYEKMLDDNAALIGAYVEAWQRTQRPLYLSVAERTIAYVLREMTDPKGGFYASQDADAQGEEGAYYHLSPKEILGLLGKEDGAAYCAYYNLGEGGLPHRIGHDGGIETMRMGVLNETVRAYRAERMPLRRDDKILTDWSAQMVTALALAYRATGNPAYLDAASRGALFLHTHLQRPDGTLFAWYEKGQAEGMGLLSDYARLSEAALSLYQATLEDRWLTWAVHLAREMLKHFEDREQGGFFMTPHGGEALIARPKETYDGAQPSGNAAAFSVLVTLSMLDVGEGWMEAARRQADFLSGRMADAPAQHMASLAAALPLLYPPTRLHAHGTQAEHGALLAALRGAYRPLLYLKASPKGPKGSLFQLCKASACLPPVSTLEEALGLLAEDAPMWQNMDTTFTISPKMFTK